MTTSFSRNTLLAAADFAERLRNAELTRLFQHLSYDEGYAAPPNKKDRLSRFLDEKLFAAEFPATSSKTTAHGFVSFVAGEAWRLRRLGGDDAYEAFTDALRADGFEIVDKKLVPAVLELDDDKPLSQLDTLFLRFGFDEARQHYQQAVDNFGGGNWAGANGQTRTFLLSLLRSICRRLVGGPACENDKAARDALTNLKPPFLDSTIKEWDPSAKVTFLHGVFARLAEDGAHPGVSDRAEALFRLRMAQVIALDWLVRLEARN